MFIPNVKSSVPKLLAICNRNALNPFATCNRHASNINKTSPKLKIPARHIKTQETSGNVKKRHNNRDPFLRRPQLPGSSPQAVKQAVMLDTNSGFASTPKAPKHSAQDLPLLGGLSNNADSLCSESVSASQDLGTQKHESRRSNEEYLMNISHEFIS